MLSGQLSRSRCLFFVPWCCGSKARCGLPFRVYGLGFRMLREQSTVRVPLRVYGLGFRMLREQSTVRVPVRV
jgi:hypothetical protein